MSILELLKEWELYNKRRRKAARRNWSKSYAPREPKERPPHVPKPRKPKPVRVRQEKKDRVSNT